MEAPPPGLLRAGTLIVCPTSVLHQWAKEARDKVHSFARLSLHMYHGKVWGMCGGMGVGVLCGFGCGVCVGHVWESCVDALGMARVQNLWGVVHVCGPHYP